MENLHEVVDIPEVGKEYEDLVADTGIYECISIEDEYGDFQMKDENGKIHWLTKYGWRLVS